MSVKWIKQEDSNACLLASLAMITGRTYAEVKADWPDDRDWNERGTDIDTAEQWLMEQGYALRLRSKYYRVTQERRDIWPCEPFADVHLCCVVTSRSHAVVMLADGTVLDPLTPEPKRLSDYQDVHRVTAVYKIGKSTARGMS